MDKREYKFMCENEENNWWFKGKRLLVHSFVENHVGNYNSVLDIGCGGGLTLLEFGVNRKKVYGVDLSKEAVIYSRERGLKNVYVLDFVKDHLQKKEFDLVLCLDVLEHMDDVDSAIKNIKKNMRKNSHIVINVPAYQFLWTPKDDFVHHKRRYTKKMLVKFLKKNGFEVVRCSYTNFFVFPFALAVKVIDLCRQGTNYLSESLSRKNSKKTGTSKKTSKRTSMKTSVMSVPKFLNTLAVWLYVLESKILRVTNFPFGTSVLCVAKLKK